MTPDTETIQPLVGLGDVRFEMTYDEVVAVQGEPHGYEDWMGGNLNGSMIYPKTLMHFDHCNSVGPMKFARIETIEGRVRGGLALWERPLGAWTLEALEEHAAENDIEARRSHHGEFEAPRLRLAVSFGDDGTADWFSIESPWCVGFSTMRFDKHCARCGNSFLERPFRELELNVFEEGMLRAAMRRNRLDQRLEIDVETPHRDADQKTRVRLWDLELIGRRKGPSPFWKSPVKHGRKLLANARAELLDAWICSGCGTLQ